EQGQDFQREPGAARTQRREPKLPGKAEQHQRKEQQGCGLAPAAAGRCRIHDDSFNAVSARRRPSSRQSFFSSSETGISAAAPARWLAPYGVPPVVVVSSSGAE